jgi:hypothetical protein
MTKSKFYHKVPSTGKLSDWENIVSELDKYSPGEEIDGMKLIDRVILDTSIPNMKNHRGESKNIGRVGGTGKRDESLLGSFEKGIDVRQSLPKLILDNNQYNLYGGYGRANIFADLKYNFWAYDVYVYDDLTRNNLQSNNLEVLEDAAISDNGTIAPKPATKSDYVAILVRRIRDHGWDYDRCIEWFSTIEHSLTRKKVVDYVNDSIRTEMADGRIEWLKEHEVNQIAVNYDPNMIVLNTSDCERGNNQRFIRTARTMMRSYYNSGGETQNYCLWNSQAFSHENIDDAHKASQKIMNDFVEDCCKFVGAMSLYGTKPCVASKVIYQKIGSDSLVRDVVDFPAE